MNDRRLIRTGIIGAVIAAVCRATPVVAVGLGAIGLSALTGYLDYVLLPALAVFVGMIGYGLHRRREKAAVCCEPDFVSRTIKRT